MVGRGLFLLMLVAPFVANAMTAEELRRMAGDAERAKRERDHRINVNDLTSLLPALQRQHKIDEPGAVFEDDSRATPMQEEQAPAGGVPVTTSNDRRDPGVATQPVEPGAQMRAPEVPRSNKYGGEKAPVAPATDPVDIRTGSKPSPATPSYVYVPPARYKSSGGSGSSSSSDVVVVRQRRFGIRIGSWFSASMNRETTNSDPGLIEIRIAEDVAGDYRLLPVGTVLFAEKRFNTGTKRLDLRIIQGVLPDGEEIELDGLVYDSSRVAGLPGIVVENDAGVAATGFKKGVIDAGRVIASTVTGGSPAGIVLDSTVSSVVDAKQAAASAAAVVAYTVHVSPQPVLVQVQTTF